MATYRGKHSRSHTDNTEASEQQASEQQAPSLQSEPRSRTRHAARGDNASPSAFKHHEALHETGKRRHSKRKTLFIAIPVIIVLAAAVIGGYFALSSFFAEEEIEAGVAVTVTIPDGSATNQIADILKKAHVINDTQAFIAEVKNMGAEQSLKPGIYELETLMDSTTLINLLEAGPLEGGTSLTIPEGLTVEQTAVIVEDTCDIPQSEFLAKAYSASEYVGEYPFLEGVFNNSLEGFLYPKTYVIPKDSNADYVVRVLLDQFAIETSDLDLTYAESKGMNLFHVVTMASLIEDETAADEERALVSSVIYNRLRDGMKLQIDATVVYALGADYDGHALLYADLEVDSPYNTYITDELPAGPICSPSINSIVAAAQPAETNYFYYVLSSEEGLHTFCETSEEFEAAKAEYELLYGIE